LEKPVNYDTKERLKQGVKRNTTLVIRTKKRGRRVERRLKGRRYNKEKREQRGRKRGENEQNKRGKKKADITSKRGNKKRERQRTQATWGRHGGEIVGLGKKRRREIMTPYLQISRGNKTTPEQMRKGKMRGRCPPLEEKERKLKNKGGRVGKSRGGRKKIHQTPQREEVRGSKKRGRGSKIRR